MAADVKAQVIVHIHGLHKDFANTQAHSTWLQQFQQAPEAWPVVHELLTQNNDEVVHHFAAHTLVTKLQAGHFPRTGSVGQELLKYLANFWRGPTSVRLMLVIALVDSALWQPPEQDGQWLSDCLKFLSEHLEAIPCLLEFLAAIPEEACNRKVVVPAQRRSAFANNMLQQTGSVSNALCKVSQTNDVCAVGALRAFARWLQLQHADPSLRAKKKTAKAGGSTGFSADLISKGQLHEHPLVKQAAQTIGNIASANLELCRACGDVLSEAQQLTTESSPQARGILLLVVQAVVEGSRQLPQLQASLEKFVMEPDGELALRAAVLGRLVSELGPVFHRLTVADHAEAVAAQAAGRAPAAASTPQLEALREVALLYTALRNTDLARCGLDFWYSVLAHHLGGIAEEEDPFDEEASSMPRSGTAISLDWGSKRDADVEEQRQAAEVPALKPHIQQMVQAHFRAVRYPPEPEHEAFFDWDEFVRFRETCSINITEACLVVTPQWIIEHIGGVLEQACSQQSIRWEDIDACVFILTGVASRAPAGGDTVIPKLIELLPKMPYAREGFKSLLFRNAASRLILFTSGYLALNPVPCKEILRFLTMDHLPSIPSLPPGPEKDAKKYCEALACDALKMVMTAARKGIATADNGTLWRDVVSAVINLVADARYNVDCRAQLVFGIGQVLSVLENWDELEQMLDMFVTKMQEPLGVIMAAMPTEPLGSKAQKTTSDGKAPLELKLYIAAISSVYNMPPRNAALPPAAHHPVLGVVEKHFANIERVCLHHTQYDELMEQVCLAFSYILGFARDYAPTSPVFVPMMKLMAKCCEFHPQPFYMGLIRSVIGFFAASNNEQLDLVLVDLTGLFAAPIASRLCSDSPLPPPINAASYDMLAEAFRHWNLTLLAIQRGSWLPETVDATIEALPRLCEANQAVHERTICSMMRFLRNILLWADPQTCKGDNAPEFQELQKQAQGLVMERPLSRGVALPRLIDTLAKLLAAAAPNGPTKGEVVPNVAEVLRVLLVGPFEFQASQGLPLALRSLPNPLGSMLAEPELQRLIQQLKMEKADSRRFVRTVCGVAEQYAVTLKRAQFGG